MRRSRDLVSSPKSPLYSPGTRAPPGPEGFDARLDNFLAKLSGRVAALATEAHARLPPQQRLPARAEALLRALGQRKLREAMEQHRQSEQHKLTPTQLYDALAVFRTPGQDLLHDRDARRLWDICEGGDPEVFLRLFREHERAGQEGRSLKKGRRSRSGRRRRAAAPARRSRAARPNNGTWPTPRPIRTRATSTRPRLALSALRLRYKTSRTLVPAADRLAQARAHASRQEVGATAQKRLGAGSMFWVYGRRPGTEPVSVQAARQTQYSLLISGLCRGPRFRKREDSKSLSRPHGRRDVRLHRQNRYFGRDGPVRVDGMLAVRLCLGREHVPRTPTVRRGRFHLENGLRDNVFDDASHVAVVGGDDRHTLRVYELNPPAHKTGDDAVIVAPCKAGVEPRLLPVCMRLPMIQHIGLGMTTSSFLSAKGI